jgi:hypothetical protein
MIRWIIFAGLLLAGIGSSVNGSPYNWFLFFAALCQLSICRMPSAVENYATQVSANGVAAETEGGDDWDTSSVVTGSIGEFGAKTGAMLSQESTGTGYFMEDH